jgi:DNA-binding IclR family transcriptional regulator
VRFEAVKRPAPQSPVGTLSRGLHVLGCVAELGGSVRLTDLALKARLDKGTTHRLSGKLVELGYLDRDAHGRMSIGLRVLNLAFAHLASLDIRTVAVPEMNALLAEFDCSISLCVLDGIETVYLERLRSKSLQPIVPVGIGARVPAFCTAGGKAIMAHLPPSAQDALLATIEFRIFTPRTLRDRAALLADLHATKRRGFAIADQEQLEGYRAVSAPVFDHAGACIGCLSVGAFEPHKTLGELRDVVAPRLMAAARRVSARLGLR